MKALPFPCIRPAQDRVLEALPAMGGILSDNDALRDAIADGLMLKDPGAAYYAPTWPHTSQSVLSASAMSAFWQRTISAWGTYSLGLCASASEPGP